MSTTIESQTNAPRPANNVNIRIYNTLTRTKEDFQPVVDGKVGIYLCGPTVYDRAHIGHMVGPVIFDSIKRYFAYCGYEVTWIVNITDVDDKLIAKAKERNIEMTDVAKENTDDYLHNLAEMGVDQIDSMPRATQCMQQIIDFIQGLIDGGYAYEAGGDVFFDVAKDQQYGKLTNRTLDQLQGEGGEAASKKRSAADFALWKSAKPGEPAWDSAWGKGRPGWHIECSAMSREALGETFDIHGGGLDLVFPHHENEIAQSECAHGKPMAKYWMHNGLLKRAEAGKVGGRSERDETAGMSLEEIQAATDDKVSRSKGGGGLADMIANFGGETLRFFLLRTHYRSTVMFGDDGIAEARASLDSFYRFFERFERVTGESFYDLKAASNRADGQVDAGGEHILETAQQRRDSFLAKMDDDFNTGGASSELFELVRALNKFVDSHGLEDAGRDAAQVALLKQAATTLRELSNLLGLFLEPLAKEEGLDDQLVGQLMELLITLRAEARGRKDFEMSDAIRDRLADIGVTLEDRKEGTGWRKD